MKLGACSKTRGVCDAVGRRCTQARTGPGRAGAASACGTDPARCRRVIPMAGRVRGSRSSVYIAGRMARRRARCRGRITRDPACGSASSVQLLGDTTDDQLLGRDEIWFAEKSNDLRTRLYSLVDLEPRKLEAISQRYLGPSSWRCGYSGVGRGGQNLEEFSEDPGGSEKGRIGGPAALPTGEAPRHWGAQSTHARVAGSQVPVARPARTGSSIFLTTARASSVSR